MVNTLGNYVPTIYAQTALEYLKKRLGLAMRVYRGFDRNETFNQGDTIKIRRPQTFTAASAPASATALVPDNISLAMSNWQETKFAVTDKELVQAHAGLVPEHLGPAAYALADKIDQDLATLVIAVPHAYIEPTAATAATIAGVLNTRKLMVDNKAPLADIGNMHFMIGAKEELDLLSLSAFSQWQGSAQPGVSTQMTGDLGQRYGFNFFTNQNRTTAAYANISDFAGATTAIVAKGATSVPVDALGTSETISKGVIIKMTSGADSGSEYTVTADVVMSTGAGTLVVTPAVRNAMADNDTFTIDAGFDNLTNNLNVAFHRDFAALAMGKLPDFGGYDNRLGAQVASVQDPVTGLAIRARTYYVGASSQIEVALDVLYGFTTLNSEMACRYEIKNS